MGLPAVLAKGAIAPCGRVWGTESGQIGRIRCFVSPGEMFFSFFGGAIRGRKLIGIRELAFRFAPPVGRYVNTSGKTRSFRFRAGRYGNCPLSVGSGSFRVQGMTNDQGPYSGHGGTCGVNGDVVYLCTLQHLERNRVGGRLQGGMRSWPSGGRKRQMVADSGSQPSVISRRPSVGKSDWGMRVAVTAGGRFWQLDGGPLSGRRRPGAG
jgi:hypothetical protein